MGTMLIVCGANSALHMQAHMVAASGTSGSSGLASVSSEEMESSTAQVRVRRATFIKPNDTGQGLNRMFCRQMKKKNHMVVTTLYASNAQKTMSARIMLA
jgi:hypothetical protein